MDRPIVIIRNASAHDFGGGERFPVFLASILINNKLNPIVLSSSLKVIKFSNEMSVPNKKSPWLKVQNWSGKRIVLTPLYLGWQIILFFWYLIYFSKTKPVAVHIQSKDDFIAATYAAKFAKSKVIWTDHADLKHIWLNLSIWYKNPVGKLVYKAAKFADNITVVSKSEQLFIINHLPNNSIIRDKIIVIHNGSQDFLPSVQKNKQPGFSFSIANRLVVDKGIGEAINAFKQFNLRYPDSSLVIIGGGPDEYRFKALAANHPKIIFRGHQSSPFSLIASTDVFLQPTYHEGFSVVLVEACMLGMPIIATSVGGNVEIIKDKETGILVPEMNSDRLLEAMKLLYKDPMLRSKIALNARRRYEESFVLEDIVVISFIPLYGVAK